MSELTIKHDNFNKLFIIGLATVYWFGAGDLGYCLAPLPFTLEFVVPGLGGLKETKNISSPSTPKTQYCGEPS